MPCGAVAVPAPRETSSTPLRRRLWVYFSVRAPLMVHTRRRSHPAPRTRCRRGHAGH
uniref:Uncharacterized protein n=1 Tax=Siphoviridae sp. ctvv53 TaxID=2826513 RepID=A0A8S5QKR9_9CAUD|nr:MAG TPA: hypothetical protein [Siphoviridae sp. ctvv53]